MKQIATGKVTQIAAKYGEHAPVVTTCCNACRACVTTNIVALATGAVAGAAAGLARVARRRLGRA